MCHSHLPVQGNLGILDVTCKVYTTVMRSHTDRVGCIALDSHGKHLASVSDDGTVRVWDTDTLQQLYDFSIDMEQPITVCYHPSCPVFACGFMSGAVYVFDVSSTCLLSKSRYVYVLLFVFCVILVRVK